MNEFRLKKLFNWELASAKIKAGGGVWGTITGLLSNQSDLQSALNAKQNSLGFTPEDVANKSIDGTFASNSDTLYPSEKATKTYVDTQVGNVVNVFNGVINLNSTAPQSIFEVPPGLYIVEKAYISGASIDLSGSTAAGLYITNSGISIPGGTTSNTLAQSSDPPPCPPPSCYDVLRDLYIPENYAPLYSGGLSCWPPPCSGRYTITGGEDLIATLTTAAGVAATVNIHIVVHKII